MAGNVTIGLVLHWSCITDSSPTGLPTLLTGYGTLNIYLLQLTHLKRQSDNKNVHLPYMCVSFLQWMSREEPESAYSHGTANERRVCQVLGCIPKHVGEISQEILQCRLHGVIHRHPCYSLREDVKFSQAERNITCGCTATLLPDKFTFSQKLLQARGNTNDLRAALNISIS